MLGKALWNNVCKLILWDVSRGITMKVNFLIAIISLCQISCNVSIEKILDPFGILNVSESTIDLIVYHGAYKTIPDTADVGIQVSQDPANGILERKTDGIRYIPDDNFVGDDSAVILILGTEVKELTVSIQVIEPAGPKIPNDTHFNNLWGIEDINAPLAWNYNTDCRNILVGVIDTGVDYNHPDLANNIWVNPAEDINGDGICSSSDEDGIDQDSNGYVDDCRGWDFFGDDNKPLDGNGHGTHVAGTIGAEGNNSLGVAGVCWQAKIVPIRVLGPGGGATSDIVEAIYYANANNIQVTNNSYGYLEDGCGGPSSWENMPY